MERLVGQRLRRLGRGSIGAGMTVDIDALGLLCPLPVLKLRKRLEGVPVGAEVSILTDDPVAVIDIPVFCRDGGHEVVDSREDAGGLVFRVRKGSAQG
ncbi:hypothetical protein GCM10011360_12620 [Primorskyibacter flagellatus]|uniref:UPF0033 domain-containing protein n=2 Tax=Primorskyibacter flagellatus TaxID=1387277 RepID=A0A917A567_9RHOB|nr:hypothetical protein GCM10011360_12620 [Primorskyibacter flagellatus]